MGSILGRLKRIVRQNQAFNGLRGTSYYWWFARIYSAVNSVLERRSGPSYDELTFRIIKMVLGEDSNCIDVGAGTGYILRMIVKCAPQGRHYAFEPAPASADVLRRNFRNVEVLQVALSDKEGQSTFQYVKSRPTLSSLAQREVEECEEVENITVRTAKLDDIFPERLPLSLMKIDVEGAEYFVIKGGIETVRRCKPIIIFECGIGGADVLGVLPQDMYDLLTIECGLRISTLEGFLKKEMPLSRDEFVGQYEIGINYCFVAHS